MADIEDKGFIAVRSVEALSALLGALSLRVEMVL